MIRDLPPAVAAAGWHATVLNPAYGILQKLPGARALRPVRVPFRGRSWVVHPYRLPGASPGVRCIVLDHDLLVPTEPGIVYHSDGADRPYATDASKFAFFCAAAAAWLSAQRRRPAALHMHDWHCGVLAVLRAFEPRYAGLRSIPTTFTIHNLAYQGQRPRRGDPSALDSWFPALGYDAGIIADPADIEVFNPMAAAIRLADRVNAVSPAYAREIQLPSRPKAGFVGGEGLEDVLRARAAEGSLLGILNGCAYPDPLPPAPDWPALCRQIATTLKQWHEREQDDGRRAVHRTALGSLERVTSARPGHLLTSVGRIVDQKMRLFFTRAGGRGLALDAILKTLGDDGLFILLGSGQPEYEAQLQALAARRPNLLFLRGYSDALSAALYAAGDLFLMPSSFEPCGISQMLAMRSGQPCVVHGVGGLKDTVSDGRTGFVFNGTTPASQSRRFVERVGDALALKTADPVRWAAIREAARAERFDWARTARSYIRDMYEQ